jgi:membrane protease YdiL (CAAX protease family)
MMVGAILIEQFILSVIPSDEQMFSYLEMFKPLMYNPLCVLLICIGAPLTEELVFRGAIQGHLMKWTKNPWVAIILASILFGLAHGNLPQFIAGFILGMVCGWLFYRTGSIWPGIVVHFINNTFSTVSTWIWGMEDSEMTGNILPNLILPIVGIILIYIAYKKLVPVTEDSVMKNEEPSEASVIEEKKEEEVIL